MKKNSTVLIGLSGGVDSTLAALLLQETGYKVIGVTMDIYDKSAGIPKGSGKGCYDCSKEEDIAAIRELADKIGIKYHVLDCREDYSRLIIKYFREEYLSGRTPNPCVKCNYEMKFGILPDMARKAGINFDYFATGHYARSEYSEKYKQFVLRKGVDEKKDQSYFLYRLTPEKLANILFYIGNYSKEEVRKLAKEKALEVHDKADSQDFYSGDYAAIISAPDRNGNIVDIGGKILGTHSGFWKYTVGQRKGLGIAYPQPLYVVELRPDSNEVVVGTEEHLLSNECMVEDCSWILPGLWEGVEITAKIRSSQPPQQATLRYIDGSSKVAVIFKSAQKGTSKGQSCVFYADDLVIGGGIITL